MEILRRFRFDSVAPSAPCLFNCVTNNIAFVSFKVIFDAETMNVYVFCVLVGLLFLTDFSLTKESAPKVQIYTRSPGVYGKPNILICHASGFHPPELNIDILQDGLVMPGANQTDLAFEENWYYHLTKHVEIMPAKGSHYSCRVTHLGITKNYHWEPDM